MEASGDQKLKELLREAYADTSEKMKVPAMGAVVEKGLIISYGPPISRPDMLLISFQGGANTHRDIHYTWPEKLLYLKSKRFGAALRNRCRDTCLYRSLERSAMALPAVFPQASDGESGDWGDNAIGAYADWRAHSVHWVKRLTRQIHPKVVIVFGKNASQALGIDWKRKERTARGLTFGVSTFEGYPAVFSMHLSRHKKWAVNKSFEYAKGIIEAG